MASRLFGIMTLVIGGVIVADILIHPQGTAAASKGVADVLKPTYGALLGKA